MQNEPKHNEAFIAGRARAVNSIQELVDAVASPENSEIIINESLYGVPSLRLRPGQVLRGHGESAPTLSFVEGNDGIELTSHNQISYLRIYTGQQNYAIWASPESSSFGYVRLADIQTHGRVSIILKEQSGSAHLEIRGLHIEAADAAQEQDRPSGYGVSVLHGAFTLWNKRPSSESIMTADLMGISAGRRDAPVLGSGIFVCGAGHEEMSLRIDRLQTKDVYSNGNIAANTPDVISGGVFVVHGASVDLVENEGPVMTFGPNDMALDNWGAVDRWICREKVTTHGPSAIGFVNFGVLGQLTVQAPIETHGTGARGYNVYSGTVRQASFDRIVTQGDGAVGVQLSQPVGTMHILRGIETHGGTGQSLVKGVLQELSAVALSIKPGGKADLISVEGGLVTHGPEVPPLEQAGEIGRLVIDGDFGNRSKRGLKPAGLEVGRGNRD